MTSEVETYLATLNGAAPDMGELHRMGVPLAEAVDICSAAHKAPEPLPLPIVEEPSVERKLNLAMYKEPLPRSAPHLEPVHELSALSLLHTLCSMIDAGRADVTLLVHQGFSPSTAEELAALIQSAHPIQVTRSPS